MTNSYDAETRATKAEQELVEELNFPLPERAQTGIEVERAQLIKALRRSVEHAQSMANHYQSFARSLELLLLTEQNMR